jgi:hypothetical protein
VTRCGNRLPPRSRPSTPAEQLLICGRISPSMENLVEYVDTDDEGNLRLVQYIPVAPRRVA